eukprot:CAMPEP_0117652996 /NCGR_PEP_ID=MMETSP0804-20121206/2946_1 /TAXON_ID=1074897 /ORGANISM="Tetraselmis astigmatica, Strain CCMP880" /LENGTH=341 /DNA_ID=CAMNT_0005459123 /DNA_START=126 /DNA_END=1151 /DNA_ORIENTATION=+
MKHAKQQASIVGNLEAQGLLSCLPEAAVLEFGAGRGYLTSMIADVTPANKLILLDRAPFRFKADRSLRKDKLNLLCRVKCDIMDFDPDGVGTLQGGAAAPTRDPMAREQQAAVPWLAVGKHLCGAATDFTLRCCRRHLGEGASNRSRCTGLAVATCCHHRCSWKHYIGKSFFEGHGFSPQEFELVSWMTGWALCGHEAPAGHGSAGGEEGVVAASAAGIASIADCSRCESNAETATGRSEEGGQQGHEAGPLPQADDQHPGKWLTRDERIAVGQMCKRLIDTGRKLWLEGMPEDDEEAGHAAKDILEVTLLKYIAPEVSGENTLLMAAPVAASAGGHSAKE